MGIFAAVLVIFGVYLVAMRVLRREVPEETRQASARVGRSIHGALIVPGLQGQAPADFMPPPQPDEVGPEQDHVRVVENVERPNLYGELFIESIGPKAKRSAKHADQA